MNTILPDRVVVINDRSVPVGGASNLSQLSVDLIERRGVDVTFFAGDDVTQSHLQCETIGLSQSPLTQQDQATAFTNGLYNREAYRVLSEQIRTRDTSGTIYHVHGWSKILSPSIFRALAPVRQRVVLHGHDYFLACPNGGFVNFPQHSVCSLAPMSTRCLTTQCDKHGYAQKLWRTARHALRNVLFDLGEPANIIVVHKGMKSYFVKAGVNTDRLLAIANPVAPFVAGACQPQSQKAFFFIGRVEPEKGYMDAAEAARRAGVPLHVIGAGSGCESLERDYPEVTLHGWKSKTEIAQLILQARAVIFPSRVPEPFGLAALETAGSGVPVIMPDAALIAEDLRRAGNCLTHPVGDVDALAGAMRILAASDDLVASMGAAGAEAAGLLSHTPESWGEALMECYATVVGNAARSANSSPTKGVARLVTSPLGGGTQK